MGKLINYLKASRAELGKVVWPTRKQTIQHTVEVIVISVAVAAFIAGVDWVLSQALNFVI